MQPTDSTINYREFLPQDGFVGTLIGRVWLPATRAETVAGPSPVWVRREGVFDLSPLGPTCADLLNSGFGSESADVSQLKRLGSYEEIMANTLTRPRQSDLAHFLTPVDLQAIKACGVTFMVSMLERVIEEQAGGDAAKAEAVRQQIKARLDVDISTQNRVTYCHQAPPWEFGISALMKNLSQRGLL